MKSVCVPENPPIHTHTHIPTHTHMTNTYVTHRDTQNIHITKNSHKKKKKKQRDTHRQAHVCTRLLTHTRKHMYTHINLHIHTHERTYIHTHAHTLTHTNTRMMWFSGNQIFGSETGDMNYTPLSRCVFIRCPQKHCNK